MAGEATRAAHTQKLAAVESGADAVDEGEEGGAGAVKNGGGEVLHGKGVLIVDPVGGAGGGDAVGVVTEGAGASAIDGALGKEVVLVADVEDELWLSEATEEAVECIGEEDGGGIDVAREGRRERRGVGERQSRGVRGGREGGAGGEDGVEGGKE